jgi:hypothetical protein
MWLPGGRAATRGRPYTNRDETECTNLLWFDLVTRCNTGERAIAFLFEIWMTPFMLRPFDYAQG